MSEYYCCSLRHALRVALPSPPWEALLPKEIEGFTLEKKTEVRGAKQQAVIDYLDQHGWTSWEDLRTELGVTRATIKPLLEKEIIKHANHREFERNNNQEVSVTRPTLTEEQQAAYELVKDSQKPSLLFGVTGSGKTEVYTNLIADAVAEGKQAILLVPEILLTEATIQRFSHGIDPESIAVLHSRLTPAKRRETWKKIRFGKVKLVIGSRSALFAPVTNLVIVVIDDEHEWTYNNEQTPRYHARETAQKLCEEFGAKLVLGSATPSIESWQRAKDGSFTLAKLSSRYGGASMPLVKVVDLAQVHFGNNYPFSNTLIDAIKDRLAKHEQTVLFLNRRGHSTSLLCLDCRRRVVSPDSHLPFTVHKRGSTVYLQDHTTGATAEIPELCPGCQSTRLHAVGAGTQKVEQLLDSLFPSARVLRADSDTLSHPETMRALLEKMQNNEADILLGTQTVVKGLDLPNVTLAGVLVADVGMSLPHFRAGERSFQLLTQLTGRSGRHKPGEVIIQTFRPDAPEVKCAALHETETYIEKELSVRTQLGYPPSTEMVRLILRGPDAKMRAEVLAASLLETSDGQAVSYSPTLFGGGNEWHIFIRGSGAKKLLSSTDLSGVVVDIDPMDCV